MFFDENTSTNEKTSTKENVSLEGIEIGFALTGSFCTIKNIISKMEEIIKLGALVYPIFSNSVNNIDTRFGEAKVFKEKIQEITGNSVMTDITEVEPIGPKGLFDVLVVAPCTGNTLSKIANGISDGAVTMACKSHLRNQKPLVLSISTNDGLGINAKNIGMLINMKNIFIVPFGQDAPESKPCSLISDTNMIIPSISEALKGKQIQPLLI